jgi:hypothetical protein
VADEGDPLALTAGPLSQNIHHVAAEGEVVEGLQVIAHLTLGGRLVGESQDAGVVRLLEGGHQRLGIIGHHQNGIDSLGDEVLDQSDLLGRVGRVGADLVGVDVLEFVVELLDAEPHIREPLNAFEFYDHDDFKLLLALVALVSGPDGDERHEGDQEE